jgi:pimeloyl-ACP methyl ester carboxylesterase
MVMWAVVALLTSACSSRAAARLSVVPRISVLGDALQVRVSGLRDGQRLNATMASTDADRVVWRSKVTVQANHSGQLDLNVDALISAMTPPAGVPMLRYAWGTGSQAFHVSVGESQTTFVRRLTRHPVTEQRVTADGLVGSYYTAALNRSQSAVLYIGGSEGGWPWSRPAWILAGEGHPVLVLSYFGVKGLPGTLCDVPLEYFETALRWLAKQPGVDPDHLVVDGVSRGGEAALLLGAIYPDLVHGVIAGVPSNVVHSGCGGKGPAWTLHGVPVPYTRQHDTASPTDDRRAVIRVERIHGPVLMTCGGLDSVWPSCEFAHAVMARLAHSRYAHELLQCDLCDHYVSRGVPGEPSAFPDDGGQFYDDKLSYPRSFAATLALLAAPPEQVSRQPGARPR